MGNERKEEYVRPFAVPAMTKAEPLKPVYREWSDYLERALRLSAYPEAIKMCEKDEDIPELAKRPMRDWGYHLDTCQAMAIARRNGEMIAQKLEDMWCSGAPMAFGFTGGDIKKYEAHSNWFLSGKSRYPGLFARDLETAKKGAKGSPRFKDIGKYEAIVMSPLMRASFEPDLILIWLTPTALNHVLVAITDQWGVDGITCTLGSHGGCFHAVVPVVENNDFYVSSPCSGDSMFAAKEPGELIFSCPPDKMEQLIVGMRRIQEAGEAQPIQCSLAPGGGFGSHWPESYLEARRMYGMGDPTIYIKRGSSKD